MPWFIRKSFKVGPLLRLNLSKSGLGYSFGVKGARIGTGPRGNYVYCGRYGLYYRQSLPSLRDSKELSRSSPSTLEPGPSQGREEQIRSAQASVLKDQSAQNLLSEIQQKHRIVCIAPLFAVGLVLLTALLILLLVIEQSAFWLLGASLGATLVLGGVVYLKLIQHDRQKKTVNLHFELDDSMRMSYQTFVEALESLANCSAIWRMSSEQLINRPKYHSGAATMVSKKQASMELGPPPFTQTDIAVWHLALADQTFYFFPDRILIYQGNEVGAVSYRDLRLQLGETRFVEYSQVPSDASVVDHTWRYTNKAGGPDRRFVHNFQVPVVRYAEIQINSSTGVNILLQASNFQKASEFASGVTQYVHIPNVFDTADNPHSAAESPLNLGIDTPAKSVLLIDDKEIKQMKQELADLFVLIKSPLQEALTEIEGKPDETPAQDYFVNDLFFIAVRFSTIDGNVSDRVAQFCWDIFSQLDPSIFGRLAPTAMARFMSNAAAKDPVTYSGALTTKSCFTFNVLELSDRAHGTAYAPKVGHPFCKFAALISTIDGSVSPKKTAELGQLEEFLKVKQAPIKQSIDLSGPASDKGVNSDQTIPGSNRPRNEEVVFCCHCGRKNPSDAQFCSQCGKPIVVLEDSTISSVAPSNSKPN